MRPDVYNPLLHADFCAFHIDHLVEECTCNKFDANGALKQPKPPDPCHRCHGVGYGGSNWGVEFCTCVAGSMAKAFYRAASDEYFKWLREQQANEGAASGRLA